uniref:Activated RNA polymerase II transcriptional coactivator p15 n=1 Tax=Pseudodiaptomus poplesia TaxID=213370 RepID=A0A1S6GLE6_9MAXI|nr:activated RNA polymerase II transcriptional coactivator p15 [Pseudodiaptomus poplesia]
MPKDKKRAPSSDSDSSGPDDRVPVKKSKPTASAPKPSASRRGDEEPSWHLGKERYVKVREFKGKTYIDIREYYTDKNTMDLKPGKKGISLSCEQYQKLKSIIDDIDHALP